jgi:hypothetical protein
MASIGRATANGIIPTRIEMRGLKSALRISVFRWARGKDSREVQQTPMLHPFGKIHLEQIDRCAADFRFADDQHIIPLEMSVPVVCARIEEWNQFIRNRIVRGDIAALEIVTSRAGPAEVFESCRPVVLLRSDVVCLVRQQRASLRQLAIFAPITGAQP